MGRPRPFLPLGKHLSFGLWWLSSCSLIFLPEWAAGSRGIQVQSSLLCLGRKISFTGYLSSQAGLFELSVEWIPRRVYNLSSRRTYQAVPRWRAQGDCGIKRGICCSLCAEEIKVKLILESGWAHLHEQDICHWWLLSLHDRLSEENTLPVACGSSLRRSFEDKEGFTVTFPPPSHSCSEITFPYL